ncbi:MAG: SDR family oxidoreductase [Deltaproteobacteria bacterium]|nr:MAG: SDR family oxidoreductase [Deltaproteobacteria bacterium]
MGLSGRNAMVTGGASGIGRAICLRLAREGTDVAVLDLDQAGGRQVADEVGALHRRAVAVEADVASAASVAAAVERVHAALGPVHILVNDAGIAGLVPLQDMSEEQWDRMIAVHLKGAFNCTRTILGDMLATGWGRIVNVSSVAGLSGAPELVHYSAAKAGLIGFTKALSAEVGPRGITVNAIAPGLIDTPLLQRSGWPDSLTRVIIAQNPIKRIGTPEDIAAACAYLVSEEASYVTGQVLSPNGGGYL